MRKLVEMLRLSHHVLTQRQIARSLNVSVGAVHKYLTLFKKLNITWDQHQGLNDKQIKEILFARRQFCNTKNYTAPDCSWIVRELKHKGVTLSLLHEEYKLMHPTSYYQYTKFCQIYQSWRQQQKVTLRQSHKAGECLFVDYAGPTVPIVDQRHQIICQASIFVAALGASNYTFAEATQDQSLSNWLASHVHAFEFFDGVPELVIPDNLKSAVSKADAYDPDINPSYTEMAAYYGTVIIPARPYKPTDKPKVENAVLNVERHILAPLRHQTFTSLSQLNQAIKVLLKTLNAQSFQKIPGSRLQLYQHIDKPALKALPQRRYEFATFKRRRVARDYHIEIDQHFYSVPYQQVGQDVDVRLSAHVVEVLYQGQRIASHARHSKAGVTTSPSHMPHAHQVHCQWTPDSCLKWSQAIGPSTHSVIDRLVQQKMHPRQIYRIFLGLLKLERYYGDKRLENACTRAVFYNNRCYKNIKSILDKGLDRESLPQPTTATQAIDHSNIRGATYYS